MAEILWLFPGIAPKWDNQCLTCTPLRGLRVTSVGGICWYTISKFNTTEYFLHDMMLVIKTASGETRQCSKRTKIRRRRAKSWFVCLASIQSGRMNRGNYVYLLCSCRTTEGWQTLRAPLIACWLLMFSEGQKLPALCNLACQCDVTGPGQFSALKVIPRCVFECLNKSKMSPKDRSEMQGWAPNIK